MGLRCRVSAGWPPLSGTGSLARAWLGVLKGVSRGVGNPRLVEAGTGAMRKRLAHFLVIRIPE